MTAAAVIPGEETARLHSLHEPEVLDSESERGFDALAQAAAIVLIPRTSIGQAGRHSQPQCMPEPSR